MRKVYEMVKKTGGATYNPTKGTFPTTGFMCAIAQNEVILDGECSVNSLYSYMIQFARDLVKDEAHLGVWYNSENGKTYLDTSFRFEDKEEALEFAKANKQLAIFDLATMSEIRL